MKSKLLIALMLSIILPAGGVLAQTAEDYFDFLKSQYNKQDRKLADFLISELSSFQEIYPESPLTAEAAYLIGRIQLLNNNSYEALAGFAKMLYLYPDAKDSGPAASEIEGIVNNVSGFQDDKDKILTAVNGIEKEGDPADHYYRYLEFLYNLKQSRLYSLALNEFYAFLKKFPQDDRAERIHRFIAGTLYALNEDEAAVAAYAKFEALYPTSEFVPGIKIQRARILDEELRDYDAAKQLLTEVIETYQGSGYQAEAYYYRAGLKDKRLKDYEGAIGDYRMVIESAPEHDLAPGALLAMAEISDKRLKAFNTAITYYNELAEAYPQDPRCIVALEEAARLHNKLREPEQAAAKLVRIATAFPDYDKSPDHLMEAAGIYESKLKDYQRAIESYRLITTQYPDTRFARTAADKVEKLKAKLEW